MPRSSADPAPLRCCSADVRRRGGKCRANARRHRRNRHHPHYGQLDERSSRLARWLIARGIGAESLVALAIGRSAALLTAIWAVAGTGAGYVPIDPDRHPADRASHGGGPGAILGLTAGDTGDLPGDEDSPGCGSMTRRRRRIDAATRPGGIGGIGATRPHRQCRVHDPTRLIHRLTQGRVGDTSGLANFGGRGDRTRGRRPVLRVLGFASPSFDASVLEYLMATRSGSVLYTGRPMRSAARSCREYSASGSRSTPSRRPCSRRSTRRRCSRAGGVRRRRGGQRGNSRTMGGLPSYPEPVRPHRNHHRWAISEPMEIGPVSLGGPIEGVALMVLDSRLRPVPVGVTGELFLSPAGLSPRGYLDRPGPTADCSSPTAQRNRRPYVPHR